MLAIVGAAPYQQTVVSILSNCVILMQASPGRAVHEVASNDHPSLRPELHTAVARDPLTVGFPTLQRHPTLFTTLAEGGGGRPGNGFDASSSRFPPQHEIYHSHPSTDRNTENAWIANPDSQHRGYHRKIPGFWRWTYFIFHKISFIFLWIFLLYDCLNKTNHV